MQVTLGTATRPLTQFAAADTAGTVDQDGAEMGTLESFTIDPGGQLVGVFSNGLRETLGQVAVASFTNPPGLEKVVRLPLRRQRQLRGGGRSARPATAAAARSPAAPWR